MKIDHELFKHVHVEPELVCNFMAIFFRFEYALKSSGYVKKRNHFLTVEWNSYADHINDSFLSCTSKAFIDAVDFLLLNPPKEQTLKDGSLVFNSKDISCNKNNRAKVTIKMIRTVRNNLFHGGKVQPCGESENGRNKDLLQASITILKT